MRKGFVLVFMVCLSMMFWTTGCSDKKPVAVDTTAVDSVLVVDTAVVDTMDQLISEQPMPKAADELFDDFIFKIHFISFIFQYFYLVTIKFIRAICLP